MMFKVTIPNLPRTGLCLQSGMEIGVASSATIADEHLSRRRMHQVDFYALHIDPDVAIKGFTVILYAAARICKHLGDKVQPDWEDRSKASDRGQRFRSIVSESGQKINEG